MKFICFIGCAITALTITLTASADDHDEAQILVITDSKHPVYNIPPNTKEILLDTPEQLLETLSTYLPDDLNQAQRAATDRLHQGGQDFQQQMQYAVQGVVDAWALQVQKIPAVIFNNQYVVYGEPDVRLAFEEIKRSLKSHRIEDISNNGAGAQND